jgi:signal transduction histidine kinase
LKTSPNDETIPTFALARVEIIVGRIFSVAALATSIEMVLNGLGSLKIVIPWIFFASVGLIILAQLSALVNFWFKLEHRWIYVWHGLAYLVAFVLYPVSVSSGFSAQSDYRPWIWWATGTASMAMGMYLPRWWAIAYAVFMPGSWVLLRISPIGGTAPIGLAVLDGAYIVLFSAAVLSLVVMMRVAARKVDLANGKELLVSRDRAALEAAEREREQVDDLIHDQVLTTLLLASKAEDAEHRRLATESANRAIERLDFVASGKDASQDVFLGANFAASLERAILRLAPNFRCNVSVTSELSIPLAVGIAITDATLQAVQNSIQHAGSNADRYARIKVDGKRIKVAIVDNGKGFHPSRVPSNRLGIRNSISRRMISVGGDKPAVISAPRKGTTITLTWRLPRD